MTFLSPSILLVAGVGGVFLSVALALTVIGVATAEKRAVSRSLAALEAHGDHVPDMAKELDRPFSERVLEPLLKRFARMGRRLTPTDPRARDPHPSPG